MSILPQIRRSDSNPGRKGRDFLLQPRLNFHSPLISLMRWRLYVRHSPFAVAEPNVLARCLPLRSAIKSLRQRKARVLAQMRRYGYDTLIGARIKSAWRKLRISHRLYPCFEEALLVLHREGRRCWCWGNKTSSWRPLPG